MCTDSSSQHQRSERIARLLLSVCSAVVAVPVGLIQCSSPPAIPGGAVGQCLSFRKRWRESVCHNFTQMKTSGMIVVWLPAPSIMTLPDHMIHYWYYYWELLYSLNVSPVWVIFPFCPPSKPPTHLSSHSTTFLLRLWLFLLWLEILQLPSQLRRWFWAAVLPHLECPPLYVRTALSQVSLKVRLKLEPFHHEALWEVPCVWEGNKYCQTRAKCTKYTALACVIFWARIYCGLSFFLLCCLNVNCCRSMTSLPVNWSTFFSPLDANMSRHSKSVVWFRTTTQGIKKKRKKSSCQQLKCK